MSEMSKKFTIERGDSDHESILEKEIDALYAQARESKNLDAFDTLYANVATFCDELLETYSKKELMQVRAYHRLIRSGVPNGGILESAQAAEIASDRRKEIEEIIEAFTIAQTDILNDLDLV